MTNLSSNSPSASYRHSILFPIIEYRLLATPSYIKSRKYFGTIADASFANGRIVILLLVDSGGNGSGINDSAIPRIASDLTNAPSFVTSTIELISLASRPKYCNNDLPTFDCNAAKRKLACGSQSMAKLTALLHRLHTPSKSMIGRVSVWNTLFKTAAGDGVEVEEEVFVAVVLVVSSETVEENRAVGEDVSKPLHTGEDIAVGNTKRWDVMKARHATIRDDATAAIIMLPARQQGRERFMVWIWMRKRKVSAVAC